MNHRKTDRPLASFYIFKDSQKPGASKVTFSRLFGHVNLPDSPGSLGLVGAGGGGGWEKGGGGCVCTVTPEGNDAEVARYPTEMASGLGNLI